MNLKISTQFSVLFLAVVCFYLASLPLPVETRYVAYVGFYDKNSLDAVKDDFHKHKGKSTFKKHKAIDDLQHIFIIEDFIKTLNIRRDKPFKYELKTYPILGNSSTEEIKKIQENYNRILDDDKCVLVVDNTWGMHLHSVKDKIRDKVPVIAMFADQNGNDFGKNALFLEPSDRQPDYLVKFIKNVFGKNAVGFITEDDYLLHRRFQEVFLRDSVEVDTLLIFKQSALTDNVPSPNDTAEFIKNLQAKLSETKHEVILLNLHSGYGDLVIQALQKNPSDKNKAKTIIGISYFTEKKEEELQKLTAEKGHKIYRYEINNDLLPQRAHNQKVRLKKQEPIIFLGYDSESGNLLRCYDAMNILSVVIDTVRQDLNQPKKDMEALSGSIRYEAKRAFQKLSGQKILAGEDLYEFDSNLILIKEPTFSLIEDGKTRISPKQVNSKGVVIPNLHVGIDIVDINDLNVRKNSFIGNLLYWVIVDSMDIGKEGYINFSSLVSPSESRQLISEEFNPENKTVTKLYRINGEFAGNFHSFDFPFDGHDLNIPIESLTSSDDIKISFDHSRLLQKNKKMEDLKMNDWETEDYYVTLDNHADNSIGTPNRIDTSQLIAHLERFRTLNLHLTVDREPWGAIILVVFPFLLFSLLPLIMVFFYRSEPKEMLELIITSFLATVAYSINLVQISPATDSMNLAYLFLIIALTINGLCLFLISKKENAVWLSLFGKNYQQNEKARTFGPHGLKLSKLLLLIILLFLLFMVFKKI